MREVLRLVGVLTAGLTLLACGKDPVTVPSTVPPFTSGTISLVDPVRGFLVEITPGTTAPPKTFVRVSAGTTIEWTSGRAGTVADLQVGRTVAVWPDGPLLDSVPPRMIALHVLIYAAP